MDKKAEPRSDSAESALRDAGREFFRASVTSKYSYRFSWLGRPVIQYPQDLLAMQEIIWRTQPDLIVETGIAHGGSLIFHASILELLGGQRLAVGIDSDIRHHNRLAIDNHPLRRRIHMIEGSSTDETTVAQVREFARNASRVMVVLDSNHTHEHVLTELRTYSALVTEGNYLIVLDTAIEQLPDETYPDRPWSRGDNPMTAVHEFLKESTRFEIDASIQRRIVITVAPDGYLVCTKGPAQ